MRHLRTPPATRIGRAAALAALLSILLVAGDAQAIRRNPTGVNVNAHGATSVFITFGDLRDQVPVEAFWCGELIPAAPDIGLRCDPATLFGQLPLRFDRSRLTAGGAVFTDIMTIPPSVARRAYQAAERGETSTFFYVRRFVSTAGGPDEYVTVTCRLTGGGARVPLALLDVGLAWAGDETVLAVPAGGTPAAISAELRYNGTGRLVGRWEVVLPGDEAPTADDLLTEATLPPEERPLQRRYTLVERFNIFLPPTGRVTLPGPDPERLPTGIEGLYQVLLRVEASDDKEGDSNRAAAGVAAADGDGVVHSGAVAGFPLPTLRYFVGRGGGPGAVRGLALLAPADGAGPAAGERTIFSWSLSPAALLYRLEVRAGDNADSQSEEILGAVLQQGIGSYTAPPWLAQRAGGRDLRWRIVALGPGGEEIGATEWRRLRLGTDGPEASPSDQSPRPDQAPASTAEPGKGDRR